LDLFNFMAPLAGDTSLGLGDSVGDEGAGGIPAFVASSE
jgi:hypothetical protein